MRLATRWHNGENYFTKTYLVGNTFSEQTTKFRKIRRVEEQRKSAEESKKTYIDTQTLTIKKN